MDDKSVDQLFEYSQNMTKALFGKQFCDMPSDKNLYGSSNDWPEKLSTIRRKQLFLPLMPEGKLFPTRSELTQELTFVKPTTDLQKISKKKQNANLKSTRDLIEPQINAIDKKKQALEVMVQPEHHNPWKLYRVISGSGGWIHCIDVEPGNMWFASGAGDGLIKIWDLASGKLRLTLTGHISGVRGLAISPRHPLMFSAAEDKQVKCWDLEQNQIVRQYHGHLSGVYCVAIHSQENVIISGGRDSVSRLWDIRTKEQIACMTGHTNTVATVLCQKAKPQFITGSHDSTIKLWDIRNPQKAILTLTHHKKAVRALSFGPSNKEFISGTIDNIKKWELPDAKFIQNFRGHDAIVNSLACNQDGVAVSGADDGTLFFWDWRTGHNFQNIRCPPQPGSIESEAGILATAFDKSGSRMITGESDKTIKMFKEISTLSIDQY